MKIPAEFHHHLFQRHLFPSHQYSLSSQPSSFSNILNSKPDAVALNGGKRLIAHHQLHPHRIQMIYNYHLIIHLVKGRITHHLYPHKVQMIFKYVLIILVNPLSSGACMWCYCLTFHHLLL